MAKLLFVIGPQRSGTTITARVLGAHPDIAPGGVGFHPYARWDIAFMAEVGGITDQMPLVDKLRKDAFASAQPFYLAKVALPVSAESLLWPRLLDQFPRCMIVLTHRDSTQNLRSWTELEYLRDQQPSNRGGWTELWRYWLTLHRQQCEAARSRAEGRIHGVNLELICLDPENELGSAFVRLGLSPPPATAYQEVKRT